jgi:hypothetical protein
VFSLAVGIGLEFVVDQAQQRSTFVTVVAWTFIALSGFGTVIAILQNVMVWTVFQGAGFGEAMQAEPPPGAPPFASFMAAYFHLFFLGFLIANVITLASSIGLLKRRNWARLCFVGLMVLAIVWNIGGLALQFSMFASMQEEFAAPPMHDVPDMEFFFVAVAVVSTLLAVGFSVLFGWIAKRLLSRSIASEFRSAQ